MKLKAGDQEMTLAPGKTVPMRLTAGVTVQLVEATASTPAGTVLVTAAPELQDATVAFK
jgi:hypothetical protein